MQTYSMNDFFDLITTSGIFSKINKPQHQSFQYLHNKIYRDFTAIINLISIDADDFREQASIILRSTMEAVLVYCNLLCDETLCEDFISDSQLFEFSDIVVFLSNLEKVSDKKVQEINNKNKEDSINQIKLDIENSFQILTKRNKDLILSKMKIDNFSLEQEKLSNLKIFCRHYTPFLSDVFKMLTKLDGYNIFKTTDIREDKIFYYNLYTKLSRRIHNSYPYFQANNGEVKDKIMTNKEILYAIHMLNMLCLLSIMFNKKLDKMPNEITDKIQLYLCKHYEIENINQL